MNEVKNFNFLMINSKHIMPIGLTLDIGISDMADKEPWEVFIIRLKEYPHLHTFCWHSDNKLLMLIIISILI